MQTFPGEMAQTNLMNRIQALNTASLVRNSGLPFRDSHVRSWYNGAERVYANCLYTCFSSLSLCPRFAHAQEHCSAAGAAIFKWMGVSYSLSCLLLETWAIARQETGTRHLD